MTDDLVKRLREGDHFEKVMSAEQAADRIEALEAKLAEADDFIAAQAKDHNSNNIRLAELAHSVRVLQAKLSSAVSTIAELTALKEK